MVPTLQKPNTALFVLLFLPFCKPVGIDAIPLLSKLFTLWKLAALLYLVLALLPKCFRAHPVKKPVGFVTLAIFWIIYILGCIRAGADVSTTLIAGVSCMLLLLLIRFEVFVGNGPIMLRSMAWLSTGCIIAHIFSVVLNLLRHNISGSTVYLFGMDNYSAFFLYPMLGITLFYHSLRYGRLKAHSWALMVSLVAAFLLTKSMTAAGAGLVLFALCLLQGCWYKLPKIRGVRWMIAVLAVLLVLICGFEVQNLLASLLNSMSKGVTLNSRTYIWANALTLIKQRPIFGHGSFTPEQIADYILYGTTHAHNLLLEILMRTGIVGAAAFLIFLCGFAPAGRSLRHDNPHRNILLSCLISQLVLSFMDFYPNILTFYLFMGILYFSNQFVDQFHSKKESV